MLFNSIDYFFFLLIVFLFYYVLPGKVRYIWILLASYYFYMNWNPWYIFLLITCTIITYAAGIIIEKNQRTQRGNENICKKIVVIVSIIILLFILGYFKYYDFFLLYGNKLLSFLHMGMIDRKYDILLPVGISFYTLQALSYILDIYRGKIGAEKNLLKYALFVSFFPQLVAGPIERSGNLLIQLSKPSKLNWDSFRKAILLMLYGLFCKIVIADRIAIIVETIYDDPLSYPGMFIFYAAVLFSFQIYCDFYGYSTIARGSAMLFGINLTDNFNAPYFAKGIKEFWRRWHISLSSWFKDYLYIPLGGNRKGKVRTEFNLLFVFCISGLWHGASIGFVFWGFLNGLYQVIGDFFHFITNKFACWRKREYKFSDRLLLRLATFHLVTFTWIFFRSGGFHAALNLIAQMISTFNWTIFFDGSIYNCGVNREYTVVMWGGILFLMLIDLLKYKGIDVAEFVLKQGWWFRAICYISLVLVSMMFGCYGEIYDTQQFIYFQF